MSGYAPVLYSGQTDPQERQFESHMILERTLGRRISSTSIFIDFIVIVYTGICIAFILNADRLIFDQSCSTVYNWTWWRLYFPQVSIVLAVFIWMYAPLMAPSEVMLQSNATAVRVDWSFTKAMGR